MAAINRVQYHPSPPISFCEGPRIIQKLKDVVFQMVELPLYISIHFGDTPVILLPINNNNRLEIMLILTFYALLTRVRILE
jgi:hypothetical protein